jgi:hypothetical protein
MRDPKNSTTNQHGSLDHPSTQLALDLSLHFYQQVDTYQLYEKQTKYIVTVYLPEIPLLSLKWNSSNT